MTTLTQRPFHFSTAYKKQKGTDGRAFCELCTSIEWMLHLFIFSFRVENWGGRRIKKKRHLSRMAEPFLFSASPQISSWPALAVKQSCAHTFCLNFVKSRAVYLPQRASVYTQQLGFGNFNGIICMKLQVIHLGLTIAITLTPKPI